MSVLEKELTYDNVIRYGKACVSVGETLDLLHAEGYDNILIPSRGSNPIIQGAEHSRIFDMNTSEFDNTHFQKIYLPFTADVNASNFENSDVSEIRKHWSRIYKSILNREEDRAVDYYRFVIQTVARRDPELYFPRLNGEKTVFIDTAISGMSSSTIVDALEHAGLDFYSIIIADEEGTKLRRPYKSFLESRVSAGKMEIIRVPKLFTEDRGPGMMGICSIVYPNLSNPAIPGLEDSAAGVWHMVPDGLQIPKHSIFLEGYQESYHLTGYLINGSIWTARKDMGKDSLIKMENPESFLEEAVIRLNKEVNDEDILDPRSTEIKMDIELSRYRQMGASITTSSSHVVHINFPEKIRQSILNQLRKK